GNIEADFFQPLKWKTEYPQPAFGQMDAADAFWAASIPPRLTDEMIRAIVGTGALSDPEAARYLTDVIIRRRDKVVRCWIAQTNPLDRFAVEHAAVARATLTFDNGAVRAGVERIPAIYKARWSTLDNESGLQRAVGDEITTGDGRLDIS